VSVFISSLTTLAVRFRHSRESGNPEFFKSSEFRLALAIASLAGMTSELCDDFVRHDTGVCLLPWPLKAESRGA
jgi:hypothetical protein